MNTLKTLYDKRFVAIAIAISLLISLPLSTFLIREAAAQTTHEVKITDFAFVPQNLTINPGDTIMWNNTDPVIHTLWFVYVANGSTYLLSDPIAPDTTWSYTFNDAVELQYYSFDMLWITGFITVTAEVHDVAVTNVTPYKTVVGQGYCDKINATVENQGDFDENFDVTAKYDGNTIQTILGVSLAAHTSTNVTFTWDTTGVAKGSYTITVTVPPVPGETETSDNTLIDGIVKVTIPGDVNGDGTVDGMDLGELGMSWLASVGDPNYVANRDINCDGTIDGMDLGIMGMHWLE